jgi:hypothetical protein
LHLVKAEEALALKRIGRVTMFEKRSQKLAPLSVFAKRMMASLAIAGGLILMALFFGIIGYHHIAGFGWIDSFLEAAMILGGMGPVRTISENGAKIFAACYALFSGLIFVAVMGIILAPVTHRMLHKFHLDEADM